jgi:metal-sulfur cluster biosynthetic enzyme
VPTKEEVVDALRGVEDPELGMDIVELGLLYDVEVEGPKVKVIHTLTSMGCPVGPMIQENIGEIARAIPDVEDVEASGSPSAGGRGDLAVPDFVRGLTPDGAVCDGIADEICPHLRGRVSIQATDGA